MKIIKVLFVIFAICFIFTLNACGSGQKLIRESGSTTVQPLIEAMANLYMEAHPDIKITVAGGGSSTGITSVSNAVVDIGASSRELTPSEARPVKIHPLALDSIVVIVHPDNPVTSLTMEQVRDIFSGVIRDWSEVGGNPGEITVVSREEGSGTQATFLEIVMEGTYFLDTAILQSSNGAVRTVVVGDPAAAGYISLAYVDDSVKRLAINGIVPSEETLRDNTYPVNRRLLLLTRGNIKSHVQDFLDFCQSPEGQAIAVKEGYYTIN